MEKKIVRGEVSTILPNTRYKVILEDGTEIMCYLGGKMKFNHINVYIGSKVEVELDPFHGHDTNRIVKRL